jgi:hypothetical protein
MIRFICSTGFSEAVRCGHRTFLGPEGLSKFTSEVCAVLVLELARTVNGARYQSTMERTKSPALGRGLVLSRAASGGFRTPKPL